MIRCLLINLIKSPIKHNTKYIFQLATIKISFYAVRFRTVNLLINKTPSELFFV